jgi:DNA invertase Pin-like site-specific DNA recombinase
MRTVRCAIYTRKSSEEGLEQAFNSLDAQREACAAYVLSQASEGWTALPDVYDDGGLSGGSLERPALQRLLSDVATGRVDIIVVYKVDRLTRSLLDFAKLVEAFDRAGVSFVSITQSFNTTTSMGRLTLNMLLSFAQFEREVTAERIRDKIAASKAKGMWMGGVPPLGYAPDGRTLKIVPDHAPLIRDIYGRYLALGNVRLVKEQLERDGLLAPPRVTASGRALGGGPFSRGQLYTILKSPIYAGNIGHRGAIHPGQHEAIIDRETWDRVQAMLADHLQGERRRAARAASPSPLAGKIIDASGSPLIASHACKGSRRYRYYVSRPVDRAGPTLRIPALEIETVVADCLARAFGDPVSLSATAWLAVVPTDYAGFVERAARCATMLQRRDSLMLHALLTRVQVFDARIEIECDSKAVGVALGVSQADNARPSFILGSEVRLTRSGRAMRLVQGNGAAPAQAPEETLIRLIARARGWWQDLKSGKVTVATLADREGICRSYVTRVVRLAFLAPPVVDAILAGALRAEVDAGAFTSPGAVDMGWRDQMRRLLPLRES